MMNITVNGQRLQEDDQISITPSKGQVDLVFTRYDKEGIPQDDCITFFEKDSDIKILIVIEGEVLEDVNWSKPRY